MKVTGNGNIDKNLLAILKEEMKPALGVTEPVAVALASAKAFQAVGGELKEIRITTDPTLYKMGVSVVVPGTNETGFPMAALLGAIVGDAEIGLEVLKHVNEESVAKAKALLDKGIVKTSIKGDETRIYVEASVKTSKGYGRAVIRDMHDSVVLVEFNNKVVYQKDEIDRQGKKFNIRSLAVNDLIQFAKNIPFEDIEFVLDAVTMNKELAQDGLTGRFGMGVGASIVRLLEENKLSQDAITSAEIAVAAACDARLGGAQKPAMSIAGSGNHGITASLPVAAIAEKLAVGKEELARALALSFLITIYIKVYSGRLSAFCGCAVTAGAGASAGIVYLLKGSDEQIGHAIKNVAADVTGIICDGGNFGCALKTSTGVGAAIRAAFLAVENVVIPAASGIVADDVDETIVNMGKISNPGMLETEKVILDIVSNRKQITSKPF